MNNADDLTSFIEESIGDENLRIDEDFGQGFVRLKSSEAQRRQAAQDIRSSEDILIELLRNSRDAGAKNIFIATNRSEKCRTIIVIDDGSGIPEGMFDRVFEPRVTSKLDTSHMDTWGLHGRGMALYSISVNVQSANIVQSELQLGTSIKITTDTSSLDEKKDQSTFPKFDLVDGTYVMRGPKNLIRCACEFALEHRGSVNVYFGSPAEIASTMYLYGCAVIAAAKRAFLADRLEQPLFKRLSFAPDPVSLRDACEELGLDISERTARRIIDNKIAPLPTMLDMLGSKSISPIASDQKPSRRKAADKGTFDASAGIRTVKLSEDDKDLLASGIMESFRLIADRYYLEHDVKPEVRARNGEIHLIIPTVDKIEL